MDHDAYVTQTFGNALWLASEIAVKPPSCLVQISGLQAQLHEKSSQLQETMQQHTLHSSGLSQERQQLAHQVCTALALAGCIAKLLCFNVDKLLECDAVCWPSLLLTVCERPVFLEISHCLCCHFDISPWANQPYFTSFRALSPTLPQFMHAGNMT